MRLTLALSACALLLLPFLAAPAFSAPVTLDIGVVLASNDGKEIDPALSEIKGKLSQMFKYTAYKLLDRQKKSAEPGQAVEMALPGNRTLKLVPEAPDAKGKEKVALQIHEGAKSLLSTSLVLSKGGMVLVGGPKHQNGELILFIIAE